MSPLNQRIDKKKFIISELRVGLLKVASPLLSCKIRFPIKKGDEIYLPGRLARIEVEDELSFVVVESKLLVTGLLATGKPQFYNLEKVVLWACFIFRLRPFRKSGYYMIQSSVSISCTEFTISR